LAAITPADDAIVLHGTTVNEFGRGVPAMVPLTFASNSDTYTHPVGVITWACIPDTTDVQTVSYAPATRVFTLTSAAGASKTITLLIWQAK